METVLVEFEQSAQDTQGCLAALEQLMTTLVAKQPEFHGARVYVEPASGTVINIMQWDTGVAFINFRDSHQEQIAPLLGPYAPKGRVLTTALEIAAAP